MGRIIEIELIDIILTDFHLTTIPVSGRINTERDDAWGISCRCKRESSLHEKITIWSWSIKCTGRWSGLPGPIYHRFCPIEKCYSAWRSYWSKLFFFTTEFFQFSSISFIVVLKFVVFIELWKDANYGIIQCFHIILSAHLFLPIH